MNPWIRIQTHWLRGLSGPGFKPVAPGPAQISEVHLVVVEGVQDQVLSSKVKHGERSQQLKDLHLHHDVRRVQS